MRFRKAGLLASNGKLISDLNPLAVVDYSFGSQVTATRRAS
jgi:hypothetical protein